MARWTFLRHGESVANAEGWLSGHRDVPLTGRGRAQAEAARAQLRAHRFDQVWTSDLQRAHHTARLVLADRPEPALQVSEALRERNLGVLEGRNKNELRAEGVMARLVTWDWAPEAGESHAHLAARAVPFLAGLPEGDTLVVGHGGLIRVLLGLLDDRPLPEIGKVVIANCAPLHRELGPDPWAAVVDRLTLGD